MQDELMDVEGCVVIVDDEIGVLTRWEQCDRAEIERHDARSTRYGTTEGEWRKGGVDCHPDSAAGEGEKDHCERG